MEFTKLKNERPQDVNNTFVFSVKGFELTVLRTVADRVMRREKASDIQPENDTFRIFNLLEKLQPITSKHNKELQVVVTTAAAAFVIASELETVDLGSPQEIGCARTMAHQLEKQAVRTVGLVIPDVLPVDFQY